MVDAADRQQLLDRILVLNGGHPAACRIYEGFNLAALRDAVHDAEVAARDLARDGRLGAIWRESGEQIVTEDDLVDDPDA